MKKTIVSVAKDLGLAPSTVSKAINNKGYVSDKTRKRILDYVKKVGYVQNSSARILKSKRSYILGVLFSDISKVGLAHPFYSNILESFKHYVEVNNYEINFVVSRVGEVTMSYLEWCKTKQVDGVLLVSGNLNNPNIIELVESDIYCVSTDFIRPNLVTVISNNEQGIDLAIEHALELNRRKIYMISGPLTSIAFQLRHDQFLKRMQELNLDTEVFIAQGFGFQSGFNAAVNLVENAKVIPDFIVVGSDELLYGAIRGLESKGFNVPNDISVIGFDDINFSRLYTPALTTIRQNKEEIGIRAAKVLIRMIENEVYKKQEIIKIPVELIKRDSTTKKNKY